MCPSTHCMNHYAWSNHATRETHQQRPSDPSSLVQLLHEFLRQALRLLRLDLLLADLLLDEGGCVRVQTQHDLLVAQRVLLLHGTPLRLVLALGSSKDALYFRAVDQAGEIGLRDHVGREQEVLLEVGGRRGGAVDGVERLESG